MTSEELRTLLRKFIGVDKPTMLATVTKVDKQKRTCTVGDDGVEYFDVRLCPTTGGDNGIVMYPKIGAFILVVKVESSEDWAMVSATEYDSIEMKIDSLIANDGKNGGLVNINDLQNNLDKLRDFVKDLATNIYTWGGALDAIAGGVVTTNQTAWQVVANAFQFEKMEDEKIKH